MAEELPADVIADAIAALDGVCDLLIANYKPNSCGDLHPVDPQNLERLLNLINREAQRGYNLLLASSN